MLPTPIISVVIPTYNRAHDLQRALKSVMAQTYSQWEILVIDNHSSDNTDSMVKSFNDSRVKLLKIHNNGVIAASRNLGIKNAVGEYVAFLDSDDWWRPKKLEESLKHLAKGADIVYHPLYRSTKHNQRFFFKNGNSRQLKPPILDDLLINGNALGTSSVVVRKSILDKINGFCEEKDVITWEDYDAWIRISKITEKFCFIPCCMGYFTRGDGNMLTSAKLIANIESWESKYMSLEKNHANSSCVWATYTKGRCFYLLKDYKSAIPLFSKLIIRRISVRMKAKTLVLIIFSAVKLFIFKNIDARVCGNNKK